MANRVTYDADANLAVLTFDNDGNPATAFSLPNATYRVQIGESDEANNVLADALDVGALFDSTNFRYVGYLGDDDGISDRRVADVDLYKIDVAAGTTLGVTATPQAATLNVNLRLLDNNGVQILSGAVSGAGVPEILNRVVTPAEAGTLYIEVSSDGNPNTGFGSYTLATTILGSAIPAADTGVANNNSSFAAATNLGQLGTAAQQIRTPDFGLQNWLTVPAYPGGEDEPGHRQIPSEWHFGTTGVGPLTPGNIPEITYFFGSVYAYDVNNLAMTNQITDNQKEPRSGDL